MIYVNCWAFCKIQHQRCRCLPDSKQFMFLFWPHIVRGGFLVYTCAQKLQFTHMRRKTEQESVKCTKSWPNYHFLCAYLRQPRVAIPLLCGRYSPLIATAAHRMRIGWLLLDSLQPRQKFLKLRFISCFLLVLSFQPKPPRFLRWTWLMCVFSCKFRRFSFQQLLLLYFWSSHSTFGHSALSQTELSIKCIMYQEISPLIFSTKTIHSRS